MTYAILSPLPPFDSPAVSQQQPLQRTTVNREKRRNNRAPIVQPLVPTAKRTQVPYPPPIMDLRINAVPSPVPRDATPPLCNRRGPLATFRQHLIPQPHLDAFCKMPCAAVCILNAVENASPLRPPRSSRLTNAPVENSKSRVAATNTVQYISASAAASRASYCYAVSFRLRVVNNRNATRRCCARLCATCC